MIQLKQTCGLIITFIRGCSLAVVEDSELAKQSSSGHHTQELSLPGHLDLALLHHVHDAADVPLLDDQRALCILHGVHTVNNFLEHEKETFSILQIIHNPQMERLSQLIFVRSSACNLTSSP